MHRLSHFNVLQAVSCQAVIAKCKAYLDRSPVGDEALDVRLTAELARSALAHLRLLDIHTFDLTLIATEIKGNLEELIKGADRLKTRTTLRSGLYVGPPSDESSFGKAFERMSGRPFSPDLKKQQSADWVPMQKDIAFKAMVIFSSIQQAASGRYCLPGKTQFREGENPYGDNVNELIRSAWEALQAGQLGQAQAKCTRFLRAVPWAAYGHVLLSDIQSSTKNYSAAMEEALFVLAAPDKKAQDVAYVLTQLLRAALATPAVLYLSDSFIPFASDPLMGRTLRLAKTLNIGFLTQLALARLSACQRSAGLPPRAHRQAH